MRGASVSNAMARVTLAEGPRMVTNIADCDFDKPACERPVKVVFKPTEGGRRCRCSRWLKPGRIGPSSLLAGDKGRVR